MQKLQIIIDDTLSQELKAHAQKAGLPLSTLARLMLQNAYDQNQLSDLEKSLLDTDSDQQCTGEKFLQELDHMIQNA